MKTEMRVMTVGEVAVEIVRKDVKHVRLTVYPPDGRVRVAVPRRLGDDVIRSAVEARLGWIARKRAEVLARRPPEAHAFVTGEHHQVEGMPYRLDVIERPGPGVVTLRDNRTLELRVRPGSDRAAREAVLLGWYRERLRERVPPLLSKWEPIMGVQAAEWRIKRMTTRWGTCNIAARRIWLNLELAKASPECLEYVVVHELVHLLERHHNARFTGYMDRFLPDWRRRRDDLNRGPLPNVSGVD